MKLSHFRNLTLLCGALAMLTMAGCYSHVTRASGPGTETMQVHPRNTDDIILGKWFGEGPPEKNPTYLPPPQ